jgi:hypothetical protein
LRYLSNTIQYQYLIDTKSIFAKPASTHCPRCSLRFRDQQGLKTHLRSKAVCDYVVGQPVEGFELDVEEKIRSRRKTAADQTDAERWEEIYRLLFPGESVPLPCKPLTIIPRNRSCPVLKLMKTPCKILSCLKMNRHRQTPPLKSSSATRFHG